MSKGTGTSRRANRPNKPQRPYKPIPVITEQFRSKTKTDEKAKRLGLVQRLKNLGRMIRGWFGQKPKSPKRQQRKWVTEPKVQAVVDLARHKAKKKQRNRRNRKATRALHQSQRRRAG